MKRLVKATTRGVVKAIGAIWCVFFPPDTDVPPSYYRPQKTQDHSEYLPGIPDRGVIRVKHTWRPPIVGQKPPVED